MPRPCQPPGKDANARQKTPRLRARYRLLEIFREAAAPIEPSKCSFDHPAFWLGLKSTGAFRTCNNFNKPFSEVRQGREQLLSAVYAVSKDVAEVGKDEADVFQQRHRSVDVLDIRRVYV